MSRIGQMEVIALASVRQAEIERALASRGTQWSVAGHVCATSGFSGRIESSGSASIAIAGLIDLVTVTGYPKPYAVGLANYPDIASRALQSHAYSEARQQWRQRVRGVRTRISLEFDEVLRRHRDEAKADHHILSALYHSRRRFQATVNTLAMAGVQPHLMNPTTDLARVAASAWAAIEHQLPVVASMREDLWIDPKEVSSATTRRGTDLRRRLRAALGRAFGEVTGERTLVHHGFYFYTPPQWALFQLIDALGDVRQIFITHDDGRNPVFETWRRFFQDRWRLPRGERMGLAPEPTAAASALLQGLMGERVEGSSLDSSLRLLHCKTPADLVFELDHMRERAHLDRNQSAPRVFAAADISLTRVVGRLGASNGSRLVDLAKLPVGAFLLRLHDCIESDGNGNIRLVLTADAVRDIAGSGYVVLSSGEEAATLRALRQALPFFRGCAHPDEWETRAFHLRALIAAEVQSIGAHEGSDSDLERIQKAARNPLRRIPWADLDVHEAELVYHAIVAIGKVLREFAPRDRVQLRQHLDRIAKSLEHGLASLPDDERMALEARLSGMGAGLLEEVGAEGIQDVVHLALGRTVEFDEHEAETVYDGNREIQPLRELTVLGLARVKNPIHVTNLGDGTFPAAVRPVAWPFNIEDVRPAAHPVSAQLLDTRSETAALGDLYLLWLALDGAEGTKVTLSYIEESAGKSQNPSALLELLRCDSTTPIAAVAGGYDWQQTAWSMAGNTATNSVPVLTSTASTKAVKKAMNLVEPRALAAGIICPRRFALQWALGNSAAFGEEHNHKRLYGNVLGALQRSRLLPDFVARRLCNDLWRNLTVGERTSSIIHRRIKPAAGSADPSWLFTLGGNMGGNDLMSQAYRYACTGGDIDLLNDGSFAPAGTLLPPRPDAVKSEDCAKCPVKNRCLEALLDD